jgi:hypothetical protein
MAQSNSKNENRRVLTSKQERYKSPGKSRSLRGDKTLVNSEVTDNLLQILDGIENQQKQNESVSEEGLKNLAIALEEAEKLDIPESTKDDLALLLDSLESSSEDSLSIDFGDLREQVEDLNFDTDQPQTPRNK